VRATEIRIHIAKPIVIEKVLPPLNELSVLYQLLDEVERVKGEFALMTNKELTPIAIQRVRNLGDEVYTPPFIDLEIYPSGLILRIDKPIMANKLSKLIDFLDRELTIKELQTGRLYLYTGVYSEDDVLKAKEQAGALIRVYRI